MGAKSNKGRTALRGALAGGAGGLVMVALMVRGIFTEGFPVIALALWERAVRVMPMEIFGLFITRLKFAAKPLGFWGMLATVVLGLAILGALLARGRGSGRPLRTFVLAVLLTLIPLAALSAGPAAAFLAARLEAQGETATAQALYGRIVLALAAYAGVFGLIYTALQFLTKAARVGRRVTAGTPDGSPDVPPGALEEGFTRREALHRAVVLAVGAAAGTGLGAWVTSAGRRTVALAQSIFDRIKGLPTEVTSNEDFYLVSKNPPGLDPTVDGKKWRLQIIAQKGRPPVSLTHDEVRALPAVSRYHTLECISNEVGGDLISNALWRGVRLRDVLQKAGSLDPKAIKIAFRSADGYTESLPVADALNPDTLLAYEMNGKPLPSKHGFPVRLLVPGLFGMKNPKWITRIEAVDYNFQGYWERSGWSDKAVVKTMSKFTAPGAGASHRVGEEIGLGGVAYSGNRAIQSVEYSLDDGKSWLPAQVKKPLGKYTWVLWAAIWKPARPGEYSLRVRARDGTGALQEPSETATLPDGASGYHRIRITVKNA